MHHVRRRPRTDSSDAAQAVFDNRIPGRGRAFERGRIGRKAANRRRAPAFDTDAAPLPIGQGRQHRRGRGNDKTVPTGCGFTVPAHERAPRTTSLDGGDALLDGGGNGEIEYRAETNHAQPAPTPVQRGDDGVRRNERAPIVAQADDVGRVFHDP
jgi:hypothetical protein